MNWKEKGDTLLLDLHPQIYEQKKTPKQQQKNTNSWRRTQSRSSAKEGNEYLVDKSKDQATYSLFLFIVILQWFV